jgi:phosphoglycerate dehydrogenase-like enzyme
MKAVLQYRASPGFAASLQALAPPWLDVAIVDEADTAVFAREMLDTEVLLHVLEPVTDAVMAGAPRLRLIQKIGVGVNTIDLAAAARRGIRVANMPGTNSQAVAELTLTLMLAVLRRVTWLDAQTRNGRGWRLAPDAMDRVGEIHGRTVGLVGYGEVPRRLAPVLQALGAQVVCTARRARPDAAARHLPLAELLAASDIVSLHVPLTDETRGMIDAAALARMKPGSVLVNTARGALVDEAALGEALQSGRLAGAGLDVMGSEPLPAGHPLTALPNVVLTPHVAWLTPETLRRSLGVAIDNCTRLRQGDALVHQVVP